MGIPLPNRKRVLALWIQLVHIENLMRYFGIQFPLWILCRSHLGIDYTAMIYD